MRSVLPQKLKPGDKIAIVAPSGVIRKPDSITYAVKLFESWGLTVELGKNLYSQHGIWAGTDEERVADFQEALNNPEIRAIICARGGYGCSRIIDQIDFSQFQVLPKWIVGFSDITVFHSYINTHLDIATIHAPMPINYPTATPAAIESLKRALMEDYFELRTSAYISESFEFKAKLIGGNLSVLYALQGTKYEIRTKNAVLFLEDLDEKVYHLDRMMQNLKLSGKLKPLKALCLGGFTEMVPETSPLGGTAEETLAEFTKDIPVVKGIPSGHIDNNIAIRLGAQLHFEVSKNKGSVLIYS